MFYNRNSEKLPEVEKAREELIVGLETGGMKYLLEQMENKELYSPLIPEVRDKAVTFCSTDTVSWYAYRRSDKLDSQADKRELLQMLADPYYSRYRKNICRCLACLCSNAQDIDLFGFLMKIVDQETDDQIITTILHNLREMKKPAGANIAPIKRVLAEGTFESRIAAAKALAYTDDPEVEGLLLDEFRISGKDTQSLFCSTLKTIGTSRSLPVLQAAYKKIRDQLFRERLMEAIRAIESPGR